MIEKKKIKLFGKPRKAVSIFSSGNTEKDLEKMAEIKQERTNQERLEKLFQDKSARILPYSIWERNCSENNIICFIRN